MTLLSNPFPWTDEEIEGPVPLRFERIAAGLPEHTAVRADDDHFTYAELNRLANGIAAAISTEEPEPGAPVGIVLGHQALTIAAMIGVLKAGCLYSVLDPGLPEGRLAFLLEDLGAGLVLTDAVHQATAQKPASGKAIVKRIDQIDPVDANPPLRGSGRDLAAVFYTSGSTGKPKGVARRQGMVVMGSYMDYQLRETVPSERQSSLFGYGYGASVSDVFGALLTGSVLCPFEFKQHGINGLTVWVERERISILHLPVALLRQWMSSLHGENLFPHLRILHLGGNAITRSDILRSRGLFSPDLVIEHRLSTTETSNITRNYVDAGTELPEHILPAGHPVEAKEILILDMAGRPLASGETGEIAIRSPLLVDGYWRRPELSRAAFIPDPEGGLDTVYKTGDLGYLLPNGGLVHLGRRDHQLKVRGYRVELTEIEAVLLAQTDVTEAVVLADAHPAAEPRLIAYLSFASGDPDLAALRESLGAQLPEYMIPNLILPVDTFPMTPTGKVDRKALPAPPRTRPRVSAVFRPPATQFEMGVAALWEDVLGLDGLGADDPFFELGGDSLSAARILQRAASAGYGEIPLGDFYQAPTISGTAALLIAASGGTRSDRSLERALDQLEDF